MHLHFELGEYCPLMSKINRYIKPGLINAAYASPTFMCTANENLTGVKLEEISNFIRSSSKELRKIIKCAMIHVCKISVVCLLSIRSHTIP